MGIKIRINEKRMILIIKSLLNYIKRKNGYVAR
jgi:hypothetical protein